MNHFITIFFIYFNDLLYGNLKILNLTPMGRKNNLMLKTSVLKTFLKLNVYPSE